jgi:FHA domain
VRFARRQFGCLMLLAVAAAMPSLALAADVNLGLHMNSGAAGVEAGVELLVAAFDWASNHARAILAAAYERAPALVMVLAALLIIPLTALVVLMAHAAHLGWRNRIERRTRSQPTPTFHPTRNATSADVPPWPVRAWIAVDGMADTVLPDKQGLVRIGRHEDNDITLPHATVHRHHALIHRTPQSEYVIVDLSGRDGNGVLVNGHRQTEARLKAGDRIILGDINLRFDSLPL